MAGWSESNRDRKERLGPGNYRPKQGAHLLECYEEAVNDNVYAVFPYCY